MAHPPIAADVTELVGSTPLVRINRVTDGAPATVLAKVEAFEPAGSVKDRIALSIVRAAEDSGALRPGGTIIEATSGNTGVGLAMVGAALATGSSSPCPRPCPRSGGPLCAPSVPSSS